MDTGKYVAAVMPSNILQQWLEALRSGKYKQAGEALRCRYGYSPLGVLEEVVDGEVETEPMVGYRVYGNHPSYDWLVTHGVTFFTGRGKSRYVGPTPFLKLEDGTIADVCSLSERGMLFSDIADLLEQQVETY